MFKKMICLVSVILILAIGSVSKAGISEWEATISADNPLHWYKFDETGSDCIDSGSGGLNGTYDGVSLAQEGFFGAGTAVGFERTGANRANFTGATDMPGPWTVEYIVKTTKPPAANDSQALHDGDSTSIRLAGWTALGEAGFTLYGVADYQFTPEGDLTLSDLVIQPDEWMHLVWRNDGSGTQLFFNGQLVATSPDSVDLPRLRIGGRGAGPADHLNGVLDEAVVFDRALSDADIISHAGAADLVEVRAHNPEPVDGSFHEDIWVNLSWSPGYGAASHDVYLSDNFTDVDAGAESTFQGNQTTTLVTVGFPGFAFPDGLVPGTTYYWRIDEVEADGTTKREGDVWSFSIPPKTAYFPDPADSAESVDVDVTLSWTPGFGTKLHYVYFGDNFDEVDNAAGALPQGTTTYTPGALKMAKTYYWRVDEFDIAETHKGNVWSFTTEGAVAALDPANGAVDVTQTPVLTWTPGLGASHEVYFGTDAASLELKGSGNLGSESYDPGQLEWDTTYYWRVDEANNTNADSPWTGPLWSFTTANFLIIDDFEAYNDIGEGEEGSNRLYLAWADGYDNPAVNGSVVGNDPPPIAEQTIVHSGLQSMPMTNNQPGKWRFHCWL
ncbi:MAG: LamG-like jellyroll fold domain-containing protein [Planctomycetota bacterium]|jgi:hypothetical protein